MSLFGNFTSNLNAQFHQWFKIPYQLHTKSVGHGPTVVMLHGIATSSASWARLTSLLRPHFRCVSIDLVGFGDSPKPDWYSYTPNEHLACINYTLKKLKLSEPFILVGHSMGGLLALHYAATYPDQVKHLVVLSPPIYFTRKEMTEAKRAWREALYARAYKYLRSHKNFTLRGSRGLKTLALRSNPFLITESTWHSFSRSLEECIEKQDVLADLEHIVCPLNLFYGSRDQLLLKANIHQLKNFMDVDLHSVRASHTLNTAYAEAVAKLLVSTASQ